MQSHQYIQYIHTYVYIYIYFYLMIFILIFENICMHIYRPICIHTQYLVLRTTTQHFIPQHYIKLHDLPLCCIAFFCMTPHYMHYHRYLSYLHPDIPKYLHAQCVHIVFLHQMLTNVCLLLMLVMKYNEAVSDGDEQFPLACRP